MVDRRKFKGPERRGRSEKALQIAEEILKHKTDAAEKFAMYKSDENVGMKMFIVYSIAIGGLFSAFAGSHTENYTLLWVGVGVSVVALTLGKTWIHVAKKRARERFNKDPNIHLIEYLPS